MAAVATKKPGSDLGVQLTFPAVFQDVYSESGVAGRYAPAAMMASPDWADADDLQGAWHAQKRADAHRMANAAVAATRAAEYRMLHSHANYFGMPKPVLSQRRFANPSLGAMQGESARRTMPGSEAPFLLMANSVTGGCGACYESPMEGGVLRTMEGQEWAARKLQERVRQLKAISAAQLSDSLDTGEGVTYPGVEQGFPSKAKLELSALLGQLENSLLSGSIQEISQFALKDIAQTVKMLVRFSVSANEGEMKEAYATLRAIYESVQAKASEELEQIALDPESQDAHSFNVVYESIIPRLDSILKYLGGMLAGVNRSGRDRKTLSRSLLKSSGLLRLKPLSLANIGTIPEYQRAVTAQETALPEALAADRARRLQAVQTLSQPERNAIAAQIDAERQQRAVRRAAEFRRNRSRLETQAAREAAEVADIERLFPTEVERQRREADALARARDMARGVLAGLPFAPAPTAAQIRDARRAARDVATGEELPSGAVFGRGKAPRGKKAAVPSKLPVAFTIPAAPREDEEALFRPVALFDRDVRNRFGDRQGAYFGELPPKSSAAQAAAVTTNSFRKQKSASLKPVAEAPAPTFGAGARPEKWIQNVVSTMKKGAFTKQALRHGETPMEYAEEVLAHPQEHTLTTRRRAQFLKNVSRKTKSKEGGAKDAARAALLKRLL